jgi:hypothetical protein
MRNQDFVISIHPTAHIWRFPNGFDPRCIIITTTGNCLSQLHNSDEEAWDNAAINLRREMVRKLES